MTADDKHNVHFEKFLREIENTKITKAIVQSILPELGKSIGKNLSDVELFNKILLFLEKKIDEDGSLPADNKTGGLISIRIKIYKKNPNTEKYILVYGYLTSLAAESLGNFYVKSDKAIDYIGIELEKGNMTAKNGGNFVGMKMSGGNIHILRNTGMFAGQRMTNGNIKIDGTAGMCLGDGISGGKIEAKIADKTASKNENVIVEEIMESNTEISKEEIEKYLKKTSLTGKSSVDEDVISRYVQEAGKNIDEWEKRNKTNTNKTNTEKEDFKKELSGEDVIDRYVWEAIKDLNYQKENPTIKNNIINKKSDEIPLSNVMWEIYGDVDIKKIEGIDYIDESKRDKKQKEQSEFADKFFILRQDEKEDAKYRDENFERLILAFKYKGATKEEIIKVNLGLEDIKKILNKVTPLTILEKTIMGYLTSVAAEKMAINGETLFIERDLDYIGMEMKNGKISVKNAGEYLCKNMYDGDIIVERDTFGNVCEGMIGGRIEIRGNVHGDYVGWRMEGGEILIKGTARNFVGLRMMDGKITVEKYAGNSIGERMEGGEILIKGICGIAGKGMKNGIIRIKEGIKSSEREGGEIYTL